MILIVTLGFEEKFQVRAVMRNNSNLEKVIIIGYFNEEKSQKALKSFSDFLKIANINQEILEVDPHDFFEVISKLSKVILSNQGNEFVVNLSGGMRSLTLAVFSTFLILNIDAKVEIETEDFKTLITFKISDILFPKSIGDDHIMILNAIKKGYKTVNSIHKVLNMPVSTVWRRVRELRELGLLDKNNEITTKGEIALKIYLS
ncbi:CRISPR-associated CARF protein Csa3 [Sulfolobus tengchongensis]|uniref:CRISPR-associated CARF protein Csa3 n=1 Tax=Sulfolobus tengchongensis TaxID=207809 RepID=A0AAX4L2D4_9CREN